ncbi:MAG: cell wall hydrolase [Clostridium sp.]|jgi:spore germination cell wall hydrolase CwlJ-like protein|nr:cell wall hydrolase [Clostridium sp.]
MGKKAGNQTNKAPSYGRRPGARLRGVLGGLALALSVNAFPVVSHATSSTQREIDRVQGEKNALEQGLNQKQEEVGGMKGEQNSLQAKLNSLNEQLTQVSSNLASLEQQIRDKEQEIALTLAALAQARTTEAWQYECMKRRIRNTYENGEEDYLGIFFGTRSISELLNAADYKEQVAAYDRRKLEEYEENRRYIEEEEARLEREKKELDVLKVKAETEKSKVAGLISQTSSHIAQYADQISQAEAEALAYEAEIRKKEEDLTALKKKLAEELRLSRQAANATWRSISEVTFEEGDRYLLANLIYCEAGGEPYDGQVAVGAVVINRVLSSVFPDTVVGVIYQPVQFSPVASGRLGLALAQNRATASCYRAADEAMSGMTNVGNCVFFRTPIEGLSGISIGGHIFY